MVGFVAEHAQFRAQTSSAAVRSQWELRACAHAFESRSLKPADDRCGRIVATERVAVDISDHRVEVQKNLLAHTANSSVASERVEEESARDGDAPGLILAGQARDEVHAHRVREVSKAVRHRKDQVTTIVYLLGQATDGGVRVRGLVNDLADDDVERAADIPECGDVSLQKAHIRCSQLPAQPLGYLDRRTREIDSDSGRGRKSCEG